MQSIVSFRQIHYVSATEIGYSLMNMFSKQDISCMCEVINRSKLHFANLTFSDVTENIDAPTETTSMSIQGFLYCQMACE